MKHMELFERVYARIEYYIDMVYASDLTSVDLLDLNFGEVSKEVMKLRHIMDKMK